MVKKQTTSKNKNQTTTEKPSSSKPIQTQHVDFPPLTSKFYLEIKEIESDQIILIPNALDEGECKRFIKFIEERPLELTPAPKKGEALRVNYRVSMQSPSFANELFNMLAPHLPEFPYPASKVPRDQKNSTTPVVRARPAHSMNPNIRLYKYTEGQHFGCHYDDSVTDPVSGTHSEWTLLIYLSGKEDGVEGGETIFYRGQGKRKDKEPPIKPDLQRGMALLHRHGYECLFHEGALVKKGTKYVLRSDIMFDD
ncbi:glycosyltransferase family 58 [Pyrrhoderma noxium]|uniref:Glycosyltransferase family 58 n=1 Tax=Pyrrhoderma noxium TaxID=2282107 RepID=A0A286UVQ8_9AGAM|nr:glycosyltransferase family 58 [Pyrrhoderma noxium]